MDYTKTKLYYGFILGAIEMPRDNDVTMVLALNRISALFGIFF